MHDARDAGRAFLLSAVEGEEVDRAVEALVRSCGGDPRTIVRGLPRALRNTPLPELPEPARRRLQALSVPRLDEPLLLSVAVQPKPPWQAWVGGLVGCLVTLAVSIPVAVGLFHAFLLGLEVIASWFEG